MGETALRRKRNKSFVERWLRDLLCGVLIGAGAILPGVSGGVLAVVFDIYRPLMETLTHPRPPFPDTGNGLFRWDLAGAWAFWDLPRESRRPFTFPAL